MSDNFQLIHVYVSTKGDKHIHEELPAQSVGEHTYKLLKSPGITLNLAKDDVIRILGPDQPAEVIERGGNFCIQIYEAPENIDADRLDMQVKLELGGTLDGANKRNLAFSAPASLGFTKINHFFDKLTQEWGCEWFYSNVYKNFDDPEDETTLDWWVPLMNEPNQCN